MKKLLKMLKKWLSFWQRIHFFRNLTLQKNQKQLFMQH